jgi:hypothetical protein
LELRLLENYVGGMNVRKVTVLLIAVLMLFVACGNNETLSVETTDNGREYKLAPANANAMVVYEVASNVMYGWSVVGSGRMLPPGNYSNIGITPIIYTEDDLFDVFMAGFEADGAEITVEDFMGRMFLDIDSRFGGSVTKDDVFGFMVGGDGKIFASFYAGAVDDVFVGAYPKQFDEIIEGGVGEIGVDYILSRAGDIDIRR